MSRPSGMSATGAFIHSCGGAFLGKVAGKERRGCQTRASSMPCAIADRQRPWCAKKRHPRGRCPAWAPIPRLATKLPPQGCPVASTFEGRELLRFASTAGGQAADFATEPLILAASLSTSVVFRRQAPAPAMAAGIADGAARAFREEMTAAGDAVKWLFLWPGVLTSGRPIVLPDL